VSLAPVPQHIPPPEKRPVSLLDEGHYNYGKLFARTMGQYRNGGPLKGDSIGWPVMDDHYRVAPGQWTVVTGVPGSGKSEFVDAMVVNLMETGDWDFAIYSPENHPVENHVIKLLEKRVRKPFGKGTVPHMTEQEASEGLYWLFERAYWLKPADLLATPAALIQMAAERARPGKKLGIVLDPWNTLDHERNGLNETDYISQVLSEVVRLTRRSQAHVWLVVHPQKMNRDREGKRPIPTPYDLSGSAHWFNKADNILCVHREKQANSQEVDIHIQKIRFKHNGQIGVVTLRYDKVVGRYFQYDGPSVEGEFFADPERPL
jgi:twinkle protein